MTTHPTLTEATIRSLASPESFSRGEEYYRSGCVHEIEIRGDVLRAEVAGRSYEPHRETQPHELPSCTSPDGLL